jgi:hypothetical protein
VSLPSRRLSRTRLPPVMAFDDVLVQGHKGRTNPGALWPDFARQHFARHLRHKVPVCHKPAIPEVSVEVVEAPAMFVGAHDFHFGHLVAELAPRLPQALAERPDLPLVFTGWQPMGPADLAPAFRALLDWYGIGWDRLRIVHRPTRFRRLEVAAQGEHLNGSEPPEDYLRLVEAIAAARLPDRPRPEGVLYVSRTRLARQLGMLAGEAYLESRLAALGVGILHPETLPLPAQMAAYAGARVLVFAEGSALHGRQLLGRIDQQVSVLLRRRWSRLATSEIMARVDSLEYVPCQGKVLDFLNAEGKPYPFAAVAFFELDELFDHFGALGVPLARGWDMGAYAAARDADVLGWLRAICRPDIEPWNRPHNGPEHFVTQLEELGLGHLAPEARRIAGDGAVPA